MPVATMFGSELLLLRRLELENIRGFDHLEIDFGAPEEPPRMQTVVVGRNGTCKTTLLRAIALGFATQADADVLLSVPNGRWLTEGEKSGIIRLELEPVDGGPLTSRGLELVADRESERILPESAAKVHRRHGEAPPLPWRQVFLCAYGMGRGHVGGEPGRGYRMMDSVATLFRYEERLVTSELVLRRLRDFLGEARFDAVLAGLKRALGLGPEHLIELPPGGGVEISGPDLGGRIPLEGWADGYRTTFSWMIDFYGWAMRADAVDADGEVRGILLVDELEQHLHPAMQKELLAQLGKVLPRVQVLTTTHSPIVALAAGADQIVSLHRDGLRIHRAAVPDLDGYSADDVLVEEALFGTDPYAATTRRRLDRQLQLARIPPEERSPEQAAELRRLVAEIGPGALPDLRDDPVVARLDELKALLSRQGPGG